MAYKNGLTNALIGTMLLRRKLNGARSKFHKIDMNPNNVSKTEMLVMCAIILDLRFVQS